MAREIDNAVGTELVLALDKILGPEFNFVLVIHAPDGSVANVSNLAPRSSKELIAWLAENWGPVEVDNFVAVRRG